MHPLASAVRAVSMARRISTGSRAMADGLSSDGGTSPVWSAGDGSTLMVVGMAGSVVHYRWGLTPGGGCRETEWRCPCGGALRRTGPARLTWTADAVLTTT